MTISANILSKNVRAIRAAHNLTQADLAKKMGITPAAVAHWELERSFPTGELFDRLCAVLGVTHAQLLTSELVPVAPQQIAPKKDATLYDALRVVNAQINKLVLKKKTPPNKNKP